MLRKAVQRFAARLRARPDKEHEITLNRLVIALVVGFYLFLLLPADPALDTARLLCAAFVLGAIGLSAHLAWRPGVSVPRRICGMLLDLGVLTAGMAVAAPVIAALYPLYLWVILGYGFRYGLRYLFAAAGLSVGLFGGIVHLTDYWQQNYPLGIGLLLGLVILPLYAASLVRKLSHARDVAQQANEAKSLFLASVSHELRTPLNAVSGMSDLLRNSGLNPAQLDMLRTIRASTGRLVSLIDDLLNVSRIDAGHVTFEATLLDPVEVLRDTMRLVAPQALEKGLRLYLHVTPRTARAVLADRRRLGEITLNLLANAVKFTRQGAVTVLLDVEDGGAQRGPVLRVEVEDTGIGIAPAAQERIFDTFTQADNTIANDFGGTGLGLAISRRLVRLQGGDIGVRSQPGRGSTFWFTLPAPLGAAPALPIGRWHVVLQGMEPEDRAAVGAVLAAEGLEFTETNWGTPLPPSLPRDVVLMRSAAPPATNEPEEDSADMPLLLVESRRNGAELPGLPAAGQRGRAFATLAASRLRAELPAAFRALTTARQAANDDDVPMIRRRDNGRRILVVDDNQVNRMVISRILEAGGHHVTLASDGEQALDRLEDGAFDLVAMDLNMPVMDGIEATKLYRMASLDRPHLPIVALTADATAYARERALDAGMDACVTKPVDAVALLELVDSLVEGRPAVLPRVVVAPAPPPPAAAAPQRAAGVLNLRMLDDLMLLGCSEFVSDVIATFISDSARHLQALQQDAVRVDARAFRDSLHALRSVASNVGAVALADLCGTWQGIEAPAIQANGPQMTEQVSEAVQAARAALLRWQSPPPVLVSRSG